MQLPGLSITPFIGRLTAEQRSLLWLKAGVMLSAVVPIALLLAVAWMGRADAIRAAHDRLGDLTRSAEEHAARVIDINEMVLQELLRVLDDDGDEEIAAREADLHELLGAIVDRLPQILSLSIWNTEGRVLVSSRYFPVPKSLDVSDWDYFRGNMRGADRWIVSGMRTDPATGEPYFSVARTRRLETGPGGVIELSFQPTHFISHYRRLLEPRDGIALSLVNEAGFVLARWPAGAHDGTRLAPGSSMLQQISPDARGGLLHGASLGGSREPYGAFRRVGDYPLFVLAEQERAAVFGEWRRQMAALALIMLPTALALLYASMLALRRTRSAMQIARRLQEESAQRLLAEEALRHAQKLEALGQLTGGVAHDFNNLMAVVSNNAHLLARQAPDLGASPRLASIFRAVDSGVKLTRQLLAFSRRQPLHPEVILLQRALPEMLQLISATAGSAVTVGLSVAPDTPPVEVDAGELEMALINLAANARDAMSGAGRIEIAARAAPPEESPAASKRYAVVSVSDGGQGIAREDLGRVFDPFFTTKPMGAGTGLGLSQVYGFCTQAGGSVHIESDPGAGTTVSLLLPATQARALPANRPAEDPATLRARVLLVDDDADVAAATASLLEGFGCAVTSVTSAEEARRALGSDPPGFDVVLSDIVMPGSEDGLAMALALRAAKPALPVVLVTGYSKDTARAHAAGIQVLAKPAPPAELARALAQALSQRPAA